MLNIDKSKWKTPEVTLESIAKMVEASYREFIVITGNRSFKLFADKSFDYLLTASKGDSLIHTYKTTLNCKLIVKEFNGVVYECFVTDHINVADVEFK